MLMYKKVSWWLWLVTAVFLTAGASGWTSGFYAATILAACQVIYFALNEGSPKAFPVQVRIAFFMLMIAALWEPLRFLYWLPAIGTWVLVLTGYCLLARLLSLMPWNRNERLSASLVKRIFLMPPVKGNILQGLPGEGASKGLA
jgi:hypothetical protein